MNQELPIQTQDLSDELYERFQLQVNKGQEPLRIDKFLASRIEGASRNKLQQAMNLGMVQVNGQAIKANYKIKPLDQIIIYSDISPEQTAVSPEPMDLSIFYEDKDVMIINKPAGMVVHPGSGNYTGTLLNGVAWYLQQQNPELSEETLPRFGMVHRIDKNTSGLLVLAKTDLAMRQLAKQFFDHTVNREYIALVWGDVQEDKGTIRAHVGRHLRFRKLFEAYPDGEHGKEAITHYEVIERFGYVTLVRCKLETGRTHQIRVHMQHIGSPIACDPLYGNNEPILLSSLKKKFKLSKTEDEERPIMGRLALHAQTLTFTLGTETFNFEAPVPKDLRALLQQLRKWDA